MRPPMQSIGIVLHRRSMHFSSVAILRLWISSVNRIGMNLLVVIQLDSVDLHFHRHFPAPALGVSIVVVVLVMVLMVDPINSN